MAKKSKSFSRKVAKDKDQEKTPKDVARANPTQEVAVVKTPNPAPLEAVLVLSNTRVPHHDERALELVLMHVKDLKPAKIVFNGDIIDFHRRSEIDRNPVRIFNDVEMQAMRREIRTRIENNQAVALEEGDTKKKITSERLDKLIREESLERSLKGELELCFKVIKRFKDAQPGVELVWVFGCQEHYLSAYLKKYFPALLLFWNQFLRENSIQKVYNETVNNTYNYGPLVIGHWHRGGINSPSAFVAHTLMDLEGVSLIQGHTNRGGWVCRTVEGPRFVSAYENFSLCKRPVGKNWQLGYTVVYREKDRKRFQVFQVPIANYGFFWGEKEYRLDPTRIGNWEKAVSISDIHRPYEDPVAIEATFSFLKEFQPDVIFVNGDVNDFEDISRFAKSPIYFLTDEDIKEINTLIVDDGNKKFIKPRLQREFEKIYEFFKRLREICPNARIIWVFGNHEFRLQGYVEQEAGQLAGVRRPGGREEILSLAEITRVKEFGVEVVYSGLIESSTSYGGLLIGHYYKVCNKSAYTARNLLQQKHRSLLQPHVHRMGAHYKTSLDGKMLVAIEQGCLCRLDPHYMQNPNWQQGFAVIHKKKGSDRFYVQPIQIIEGAFLFGGKRFGRPNVDNPAKT